MNACPTGRYPAHLVKAVEVPQHQNAFSPSQATWSLGQDTYQSTEELLTELGPTGPEGVPARLVYRHRLRPLRDPLKILTGPPRMFFQLAAWCMGRSDAMPQLPKIPPLLGALVMPLVPLASLSAPIVYNIPWVTTGFVEGLVVNNGGEREFLYQTEDDSGMRHLNRVDLGSFREAPVPVGHPEECQWWNSPSSGFLNPMPCPPTGLNSRAEVERLLNVGDSDVGLEIEENHLLINGIPLEISS